MKRFITTSPSFVGEVYIVYDDTDTLCCIDLRHAQLSREQVHYMRTHTPTVYDNNFTRSFGIAKLYFVEEQYRVSFDEWWQRYNRKINRARAERLWDRLSKVEQIQAFNGIVAYDRHLQHNSWKTKADPETYIRNKYWQNEWK